MTSDTMKTKLNDYFNKKFKNTDFYVEKFYYKTEGGAASPETDESARDASVVVQFVVTLKYLYKGPREKANQMPKLESSVLNLSKSSIVYK